MPTRAGIHLLVASLFASAFTLLNVQAASARPRCRGHEATKVGTGQSERIDGTSHRDVIVGLAGDDILVGFGGNDVICGGPGNDDVVGLGGDDKLDGGPGHPSSLYDRPFEDLVLGGAGNDSLFGGPGYDVIGGHGGDDRLLGGGGGDALFGHAGRDTLEGQAGYDLLHGGANDDRLTGGGDRDLASFYGGPRVRASLAEGRARGAGRDRLDGIENLEGSKGKDRLGGDGRTNFIFGLAGNDLLFGKGAQDLLMGYGGNDRLDGGAKSDTASYFFTENIRVDMQAKETTNHAGDDTFVSIETLEGGIDSVLKGNSERNVLMTGRTDLGGYGDTDKLFGRGGNDLLFHRHWADTITYMGAYGGDGNDTVIGFNFYSYGKGGPGNDVIRSSGEGQAGRDVIVGQKAQGGAGNDVLIGTAWEDDLYGGAGDDVFHGRRGADDLGHDPDSTFDHPTLEEAGHDIASSSMAKGPVEVNLLQTGYVVADGSTDQLQHEWFSAVGSRYNDVFVGSDEVIGDEDGVGDDRLWGWKGNDDFTGNGGDDILNGGKGNDDADAGNGLDKCPGVETVSSCENFDPPLISLPSLARAAPVRGLLIGLDDIERRLDLRPAVSNNTSMVSRLRQVPRVADLALGRKYRL